MVVAGSRKLASEREQLKLQCESLQAEMAQNRSDAEKHIADLEARVKSANACSVEIAAESEKNLRDFESEFVQKLEGLREMYADNIQIIGGLCSPISMEEPSVEHYLNYLSEEVAALLDMFCGVNKFLPLLRLKGLLYWWVILLTLKLCGLQPPKAARMFCPLDRAIKILPVLFQKSGGTLPEYDYVLSVIHTQQAKVLSYF
jgi:hypothetical protein